MDIRKQTISMQVKSQTQTGFSAEIKSVPPWAMALAAIGFAAAQFFINLVVGRQPDAPPAWGLVLLGLLLGTVLGSYILLIGYVSRDSRRRGMSSLLWTVVAIVIPNGLGIILYFLLRQPRQSICPECGNALQPGFNFCPRCSYHLSQSCPQCQRPVGENDTYCPYCGTSLRNQAAQPVAS